MVYAIGIALIYGCKLLCGRVKCISDRGADFSRRVFIFAAFTILFLISALRGYNVGIDTQNYAYKFLIIRKYSFRYILTHLYTERVEFGYALMNKLLGLVFANPRAMIIANSAVVCYGMAFFVYRYTREDVMAVIILCCCGLFAQSLNLARQIMACMLLMNAWGKLTENKIRHSVLLFFLGVSMHITAVIFGVVYYFYFFRNNKKVVLISFALSLLVAMFYRPLLMLASRFTDAFHYLDNEGKRISADGIWAVWAVELVMAVYFAIRYLKSKDVRSGESLICVPIFTVYYILFTFLGTQFNNLDRFGLYFMPFTVPLMLEFGNVIQQKLPRLYKLYRVGVQVCFIGLFLLSMRAGQYAYSFGW